MLLAIDSGNTNIVFAVFDGDALQGEWRSASESRRTADEYGVWLAQLTALNAIDAAAINEAIIATVVPETLFSLQRLCRHYYHCEPLVVGAPGVQLGIEVLVDDPAEVGADRLVNAVAAGTLHGGPLIVIDFGTATTFDVIDADGNYCGGAIAPGINLSLEALHLAAAKLPRVAVEKPERVIGKRTTPAMLSGVYWGYVGLIEGMVARIKQEFGAPMRVIATGGHAKLFNDATEVIDAVDQELTLRGLAEIHARNKRP